MESLNKARLSVYIWLLVAGLFFGSIIWFVYSCVGIGPCVYKNIYTKSDIILYEDSILFWDSYGVDKICSYKKKNTEYCNFEINTVHGDFLKFDVVVNYEIDPSKLTKNDLYLFIDDGFGFLKDKSVLSYEFQTNIKEKDNRSVRDLENDIKKIVENLYSGLPSFIKDFDVGIKIYYIK